MSTSRQSSPTRPRNSSVSKNKPIEGGRSRSDSKGSASSPSQSSSNLAASSSPKAAARNTPALAGSSLAGITSLAINGPSGGASTSAWTPYSPATSRSNSPTHSRTNSPTNSRPSSPRATLDPHGGDSHEIDNLVANHRRTSATELNSMDLAADSRPTRPRAGTPRSNVHPSGAQTARGLSTSKAFAEFQESEAKMHPSSTMTAIPRPMPPGQIKHAGLATSGDIPHAQSEYGLSSSGNPQRSPAPTAVKLQHSPLQSARNSVQFPRSSSSPSSGPSSPTKVVSTTSPSPLFTFQTTTPPAPPPMPPRSWKPSSPSALSTGPAASGDVKAMLKDLEKKKKEEKRMEKETKKAKKEEEKRIEKEEKLLEKEEKAKQKEAKKLEKEKSKTKDKKHGSPDMITPAASPTLSHANLHTSNASPSVEGGASSSTSGTGVASPQPQRRIATSPERDRTSSSPKELLQQLAASEEHGAPPKERITAKSPPMVPETTSTKLSDFRIIKLIGKGGFGEVYLAEHKKDQRKMALKVLDRNAIKDDKKARQVFNERAVLLKSCNSPFLLSLHYAFEDEKNSYFAMTYCPGGDLRALLSAIGAFEEDEARLYMAEMIVSVQTLHTLGYIHRDLKPDNFLIDASGHLILADFGLSKELYETVKPPQQRGPPGPPGTAPALDRQRSLSTINFMPMANGQAPSKLLGPQQLVALNAANVDSRFVRRRRRHAQDMTNSYNPAALGTYSDAGPFAEDQPMTASYVPAPGSSRLSVIFEQDSPLSMSYNPATNSFAPSAVRPVIQYSDLPSKAQKRRLMAYSVVGSPDYMSPEVLSEHGYGEEVDWWSVGCLCFELVLGIPPFTGQSIEEVFDNIANWETRLPQILEQYQSYLSPVCFDLLTQLLCDPSKRLGGKNGIAGIKKHPFFAGLDWDRLHDEEPPFIPRLENEEDTSYFEANVANKQQAFLPTTPSPSVAPPRPSAAPAPVPTPTPDADPNPNSYYQILNFSDADIAQHIKNSLAKQP